MIATKRARNLEESDIVEIVAILDGWTGKLSWMLLVEAIGKRLHQEYTRQALNNHLRIATAFKLRKKALAVEGRSDQRKQPPQQSQELTAAMERISALEAAKLRLEAENAQLLEQYVRWAYNAYTRGLDEEFLSRPLPSIDRNPTTASMETLSRIR